MAIFNEKLKRCTRTLIEFINMRKCCNSQMHLKIINTFCLGNIETILIIITLQIYKMFSLLIFPYLSKLMNLFSVLQTSTTATAGDRRFLRRWPWKWSRQWRYRDRRSSKSGDGDARLSASSRGSTALLSLLAIAFSHRQTLSTQMLLEMFLHRLDITCRCSHRHACVFCW